MPSIDSRRMLLKKKFIICGTINESSKMIAAMEKLMFHLHRHERSLARLLALAKKKKVLYKQKPCNNATALFDDDSSKYLRGLHSTESKFGWRRATGTQSHVIVASATKTTTAS